MHCWPKGEFVLAMVVRMDWRLNCYDNYHTWKHNVLLEFFFPGCYCREGKDSFGTTCTVIKCKQRLYVMYRVGLDMD